MINSAGCVRCVNMCRRLKVKISENRFHARIVDKGHFSMFKISRIRNIHVQAEEEVLDSFERTMEADAMSSRCKFYDSIQELGRVLTMNAQETLRSKNGRIEWFRDDKRIDAVLKSKRYYVVVDRSFFPEDSAWISVIWIFSVNKRSCVEECLHHMLLKIYYPILHHDCVVA